MSRFLWPLLPLPGQSSSRKDGTAALVTISFVPVWKSPSSDRLSRLDAKTDRGVAAKRKY